jgi:FecR protein
MKKARNISLVLLGVAVLLGGFFWWFWSIGSIQAAENPALRLVIQQGSASVQSGAEMERSAKSGMEVQTGDVIKTAQGSRVSVVAEGRSDLRLDENTEIKVEEFESSWDQGFVFRFKLNTGKTWSRILKLLDLDSAYEGQTDNVVATVRGTAFALENVGSGPRLFVGHSAVTTPLQNGMGEDVFTLDEWSFFDEDGRVMLRGNIASSTWLDREWIDSQKIADKRFVESGRKKLLESLSGDGCVPMDNWLYNFSRSSERLHLKFSGDECKDLTLRYLGRQLFDIYDLAERGKTGLAFQFLSELEKEINEIDDDDCVSREDFAEPVGTMLLAISDISPEDDLYKLKLKFEELYIGMFQEYSAEAYWAHALALDTRLDELERFGCRPDFKSPMERALEAVEQGLARQDSDFELLPANVDEEIRILLANKTHVQHVRLERFIERLEQCEFEDMHPMFEDETATSTTSTEMEAPTSTEDVNEDEVNTPIDDKPEPPFDSTQDGEPEPVVVPEPKPEPEPEPEPVVTQPTSLDLLRIQLFAQPNPVNVGGISSLYVKGYRKDGSELDATSYASFEQIGNLGSIIGAKYQAGKVGSVTIIARVNDNGQEFMSQVSLRIMEPMALSHLEVSGNGSAQVYQGDTRQLSVIAHYTNGEIKTVTSYASYSISNTQIGTMSGSLFRAGFNGTGWVSVTAQYTEEGVTKQGEISFEVIADTGYQTTP